MKSALIWIFFLVVFLQGQESPPVYNFLPEEYKADTQNWMVTQDAQGNLLFANNDGVLEFNGERWDLTPSPNGSIIRSIFYHDDKIYIGSYKEFGFYIRDEFNSLKYTSLSGLLVKESLEGEEIWSIKSYNNFILFQSKKKVYSYNLENNSITIIDPETSVNYLFVWNNRVYIQSYEGEIFQLQQKNFVRVAKSDLLKFNRICLVVKIEDDVCFVTEKEGFLIWKNSIISPAKYKINKRFKKEKVFSGAIINEEEFVIGTVTNGLFKINSKGDILLHVNKNKGLLNNTLLNVYVDRSSNIWLALDAGISRVNSDSNLSFFKDENIGTVYASFLKDEILYLGTNQGLYYKKYPSEEPFRLFEETQGQVWSLKWIHNTLFCGHDQGIFIIENNNVEKIASDPGAWCFAKVPRRNDFVLVGNYNGILLLNKVGNKWIKKDLQTDFNTSTKYIEFTKDRTVWVGQEYNGVSQLRFSEDYSKIELVESYGNGILPEGRNASLFKFQNDLIYRNNLKNYVWNEGESKFELYKELNELMPSKSNCSAKMIVDDYNNLWFFTASTLSQIVSNELDEGLKLNSYPLGTVLGSTKRGFENISPISDQNYIIGTDFGYINFRAKASKIEEDKLFFTKISFKDSNDSNDGKWKKLAIDSSPNLNSEVSNVNFEYSLFNFKKNNLIQYSNRLIGNNDNWSSWSTSSSRRFENLSFGSYEFEVRAKIGDDYITDSIRYNFLIERPFYLINFMLALYILLGLGGIYFVHKQYNQYFNKQKQDLIVKSERKLEIQKLENEKQVARLKNQQLESEIKSKNRELAIATMSMIKKKEILRNLKKELEESSDIKKVIKEIDKNIKSDKDWEVFEKAFNMVDVDFLKKIKILHPDLTANDLKFCAYLRLNLSSKEIAPLLNISSRSVEIKRYRLRKKLKLQHEQGLTEYVLSI